MVMGGTRSFGSPASFSHRTRHFVSSLEGFRAKRTCLELVQQLARWPRIWETRATLFSSPQLILEWA